MNFNNPLELISFANLLIKVGSDISTKVSLKIILDNEGFEKIVEHKKN